MACASCKGADGTPNGCGNKGHCSSGSCNKLNTYDWLAKRNIPQPQGETIVEVSFKKGARKDFFFMEDNLQLVTGDMVVVNSGNGYDIGSLSLMSDLVALQMKKKRVSKDRVEYKIIRKANERDLEKLNEARMLEKESLVKARVIARTMELDMKLGDVEYQGDKRKATFYYTAEGRVDFRELVRAYAKEFRVKIEMRQIGSRQESARIGGIGSCGRELCCSTWLTDFKSVSTTTARYQYMAINQSKLSGQCGRLKCCLNYELDAYVDALSHFPEKADFIKTMEGKARLLKIDIFKGLMYYSISKDRGRPSIVVMDKEDVKAIIEQNKTGQLAKGFDTLQKKAFVEEIEDEPDYEDVTGAVELPSKKKSKRRRPSRSKNQRGNNQRNKQSNKSSNNSAKKESGEQNKENPKGGAPQKSRRPNQKRRSNNNNKNKPNNKQGGGQSNAPKDAANTAKPDNNGQAKPKPKRNNKRRRPFNKNKKSGDQSPKSNKSNES